MVKACAGLKVLDFSQGYGAIPGMILADYGAEVIKVEPPGGEAFRHLPAFLQWNRGKKGVALDLKSEEGRRAAQALARESDVLIENYRPGVAERLGIAYEELSRENPGLIYLSISAFGQSGKYRNYKGYEGIVSAKCGQHIIQNGYRDDGPIYDAVFKCSYGSALLGFIGILAAVHAREKTGAGQKVESTMAQANFVYSYGGIRFEKQELNSTISVQGRDPQNRSTGYRIAQCADGKWIQSGNAGAGVFTNMMRALDIDEYFNDPRFKGKGTRFDPEDRDYLISRIDEVYKTKPLAEWIKVLNEHDAAYGVFLTTQEFMDYPQIIHNGNVIELDDPTVGRMKQIGPIATFVGEEWQPQGPAPRLGEHTQQVLAKVASPSAQAPAPASDPGPAAGDSRLGALPEGALAGVTIVDLSMWAAAPGGPAILADLGARVIKIEPLAGDPMGTPGELFFRVTRGKERISIDLKRPEGRKILHQIVAEADVLVHNFRPGVPERLALDYETLREVNPRLVYLYAASFGSSGPDAHRPAFDPVVSAMAGGEVLQAGQGNPPQQRQTTDHSALLGVAAALLVGLRARDLTGQSQNIETTMLVSAAYLFSDDFLRYEGKPDRPVPDKGQYGLGALYRLYEAQEGWVFLAAPNDGEWYALCQVVGQPGWRDDPKFSTKEARRANDEALVALLKPLFQERLAGEWETLLQAKDVACAVASGRWADFLFDDWDGGKAQSTTTFSYPGMGRIHQSGMNVALLGTPGNVGVLEPLGTHTRPILENLGYSAGDIDDLKASNVINWAES